MLCVFASFFVFVASASLFLVPLRVTCVFTVFSDVFAVLLLFVSVKAHAMLLSACRRSKNIFPQEAAPVPPTSVSLLSALRIFLYTEEIKFKKRRCSCDRRPISQSRRSAAKSVAHRNGDRNGHSDHRVVAGADKSHHLNVSRN